jgi:hypothetical protein
MSDLANLVLAGVRDKVVQDLKDENEQLLTKNIVLSKAMLLQAPSFARVEIGSCSVVARTQQFPDPLPKCDCCSWYPMTMEEPITVLLLADIDLYLGSIPGQALSKSTRFLVHQVTGYATESETTALQISDVASGGTLHLAIGPIPKPKAKTLFAKTPRDLKVFCQRFHDVAPTATVEIVCYSIPNIKAVQLLTSKGGLTEEEARNYLKIPSKEEEEEQQKKSSTEAVVADEAKEV